MKTTIDWPPPYTLRHSPRARSVRLQICTKKGLQLIVPRWFKREEAPQILCQHRSWIERTWLRVKPQSKISEPETLPESVHLLAINEIWQIHYRISDSSAVQLETKADGQLEITGKIHSHSHIRSVLLNWLKSRGRKVLIPWLDDVSLRTQLRYTKVGIRSTTTRWGSCSFKKHISLNCKLLLLPRTLVEHILLHELCHTVYMNHSRQFWDLVKSFDPDCHLLRKELKQTNRYIPTWIEE